ncbi:winged helix-turn-helix transcriptional regulator [Mesorhizobium sp. IMUNJ 23232]|uniref:winged helix-turn-helix transcriptional regulator n=1 Tax=Mesorhizobium sp. IMUNJ 23232 TaxID=3376064 RepID=UPI0037AE2F55
MVGQIDRGYRDRTDRCFIPFGCSVREIAEETGLSKSKVNRLQAKLKEDRRQGERE